MQKVPKHAGTTAVERPPDRGLGRGLLGQHPSLEGS